VDRKVYIKDEKFKNLVTNNVLNLYISVIFFNAILYFDKLTNIRLVVYSSFILFNRKIEIKIIKNWKVGRMRKYNKIIYRETQRPNQIWIWALVLPFAIFSWYSVIQQVFMGIPLGSKPAPNISLIIFWLIFGIVFPMVLIWFLKLIIEVRADGVYIRFMPFHLNYRRFLYKDIVNYELIDYSFSEFGGWGIRVNIKGEKSYTMHGKQGVKLKLKNETVVIGTQKQIEMINAIDSLNEKH